MKYHGIAAIGMTVLGTSAPVGAQQAPTAEKAGGLEEIVVTAQRREQGLQTTPVSVSAFGPAQLESLPIVRVENVGNYVPNMYLSRGTSNPSTPNVTLRGAGEGAAGFATSEPPVAFYLDDVYQARLSGTNLEFVDIERIEVLRGPQGTLFGRNSTAGAVNVITREPGRDFFLDVLASYGSYDEYKLKAAIGGPVLDDRVAASLSVAKADQERGYKTNIVTGNDQEKMGFQAARVNLRWIGSEAFDARVIAYYSDASNDGFVPTAVSPATLLPVTGDYSKVQLPAPSLGDTESWGANGRFRWDLGPVVLKSISAYSAVDDLFRLDLSGGIRRPNGTYLAGFDRTSVYDQNQFTQELQLLSAADSARLSWIVGLYYFRESVAQILADRIFSAALGAQVALAIPAYSAGTKSYAGYGQLRWQATDRVAATIGLRHSKEDKDISGRVGTVPFANSTSDSATTPRLALEFRYSDDILLFGSVSRGFKAGGFNGGGGTVRGISTPFDAERVTSYEVGAKTEWLDHRLRLNSALFFMQYRDLQGGVFVPGTTFIVTENAIDLEQIGAEFELTAVPTDRLQVFAVVGLQDEDFTRIKPGTTIAAANPKRRPGVSHVQATVGFSYTLPLSAFPGQLRLGADFNYRDPFYSAPDNNSVSRTSEQARVNAAVAFLSADERWEFKFEGRNVTDAVDWYNGLNTVAQFGTATRTTLEPRLWSASLRYRYR